MATPMAFILPTASYLRLSRREGHWYSRRRLIAWTVMVFGFIVMVIGTGLSIEQVMDTSSTNRTFINYHILNQDSILSGHYEILS